MLKLYCEKALRLFVGKNAIGYMVQELGADGNIIPMTENPTVSCEDLRVDVKEYSILKLKNSDFSIGDKITLNFAYGEETLSEVLEVVDNALVIEPEVEKPENTPVELQILDGVNLLIELQADMLGGAI